MKNEINCEFSVTCAFFNDKMAKKLGTANLFKKIFCCEHKSQCARYMIIKALGMENVPADLFPTQKDRATALISAKAQ